MPPAERPDPKPRKPIQEAPEEGRASKKDTRVPEPPLPYGPEDAEGR